MNFCLFCAAPSSSPEKETGESVTVKSEVIITGDDDYHSLHDPLSESGGGALQSGQVGGSSATVKEHLKASFILNKILKIPQDSISQLLRNHVKNGQVYPLQEEEDISLNVCSSCGDSVALFYKTLEQVLELERNLAEIEVGLKRKMQSSSQVVIHPDSINRKIRSQVLNGLVPEASQEAYHLNHDDFLTNIKSEVVDDDTMAEDGIPEEHHEQDHDESEEAKLKRRLDYMVRTENPSTSFPTHSSDPLSFLFPVAERKTSSKEDSPVVPATRKLEGDDWRSYPCDKCPFRSCNKSRFTDHAKTHEEGSEATICWICGWFVFPDKMIYHHNKRHFQKQREEKEAAKKKAQLEKEAKKKRPTMYYHCPECNALISGSLANYRNHEEMHAVARGFICPDCKWLVTTLTNHRTRWHPTNKEVQMPLPDQIIKM